jgi:hypothetical protein
MTAGDEICYVREVMLFDMTFDELVRRAGVTADQWRDMEAGRLPAPGGFFDELMRLVGGWHDEQEERARLN